MSRSTRPHLLKNTCSVAGFTGLVKCAGAVKLIIGARSFGAGDALDAYLLAFLVPSFLADLLAGSLGAVLLPAFIQSKETAAGPVFRDTYAEVLYKVTTLFAGLALLIG